MGETVWHWLHSRVNRLAWRYGMLPSWDGKAWGKAAHIDKGHWLWRLNSWLADRWVPGWLEKRR